MLSKINEELLAKIKELCQWHEWDCSEEFDVREGSIVACIKVRNYLDETDIETVIATLGMQKFRKKILKEFNGERLENTFSHALEMDVEDIQYSLDNHVDCFPQAIQEALTNFIPAKQVRTYGRSGGYLAICDKLYFECNNEDIDIFCSDVLYDAEGMTNKEFNDLLKENDMDFFGTKKQTIKAINERIKEIETCISSVHTVIDYAEDCAKEWTAIGQLECDIESFIESENYFILDTISIFDNTIKTSRGLSVPLEEAKKALSTIICLIPTKGKKVALNDIKIGNYIATKLFKKKKRWIVQVGCHKIELNHAKQILAA